MVVRHDGSGWHGVGVDGGAVVSGGVVCSNVVWCDAKECAGVVWYDWVGRPAGGGAPQEGDGLHGGTIWWPEHGNGGSGTIALCDSRTRSLNCSSSSPWRHRCCRWLMQEDGCGAVCEGCVCWVGDRIDCMKKPIGCGAGW